MLAISGKEWWFSAAAFSCSSCLCEAVNDFSWNQIGCVWLTTAHRQHCISWMETQQYACAVSFFFCCRSFIFSLSELFSHGVHSALLSQVPWESLLFTLERLYLQPIHCSYCCFLWHLQNCCRPILVIFFNDFLLATFVNCCNYSFTSILVKTLKGGCLAFYCF